MHFNSKDEYLEEKLRTYEAWMLDGKIPFTSKVLPIRESLSSMEWVLPTNQVVEIIRNARSFAVQDCICRTKYHRCDNPLEVCLVINDIADLLVSKGRAKYTQLADAIERLKFANEKGLVHLTLYNLEQHIYAVCSCCDCCCHHLQIMKLYERPDMIAHSDYIAVVDKEKCINCGKCAERCIFGAQLKSPVSEDTVEYHHESCYGCGLCLTTCPTKAISLKLRR